jgi:hypothetical protein
MLNLNGLEPEEEVDNNCKNADYDKGKYPAN